MNVDEKIKETKTLAEEIVGVLVGHDAVIGLLAIELVKDSIYRTVPKLKKYGNDIESVMKKKKKKERGLNGGV